MKTYEELTKEISDLESEKKTIEGQIPGLETDLSKQLIDYEIGKLEIYPNKQEALLQQLIERLSRINRDIPVKKAAALELKQIEMQSNYKAKIETTLPLVKDHFAKLENELTKIVALKDFVEKDMQNMVEELKVIGQQTGIFPKSLSLAMRILPFIEYKDIIEHNRRILKEFQIYIDGLEYAQRSKVHPAVDQKNRLHMI